MVAVVLGMLFCVGLALAVMALVAVPARRAGRDVLTERGEEALVSLRERPLSLGRGDDTVEADAAALRLEEPVGASR